MSDELVHATEDDLIELLCGDAQPDERARVEAHLKMCDDCQTAWNDLTAALTMVGESVPEPPAGFERVIWARVREAIAEPARTAWTWRQWAPTAALAAVVLIAAGVAGRYANEPETASPSTQTAAVGDSSDVAAELKQSERVLLTALERHLQQMATLLVELRNAPDRALLGMERAMADDLLIAGRLYRVTAEDTGNYGLASMLDDLETVLVEVARSPERLAQRERQWLRTQIDDRDLLFKVRAVSNDIRDRVDNNDE